MNAIGKRANKIADKSDFIKLSLFGKCVVVACKMPNGHVIVESYAFADCADYNEQIGVDYCLQGIVDKILELEAYASADSAQPEKNHDIYDMCPFPDKDCSGCPCYTQCIEDEYYDEYATYDEDKFF